MAINYITYNPDTLPEGDRIVILNGNNPPRFDSYENLLKKVGIENMQEIILDNQARINNLEDTEIGRIVEFLDRISIKKQFIAASTVEVEHFRKQIISVKVMKVNNSEPGITEEVNITAGTRIREIIEKDSEGKILNKKVILDFGDSVITGYVIII